MELVLKSVVKGVDRGIETGRAVLEKDIIFHYGWKEGSSGSQGFGCT